MARMEIPPPPNQPKIPPANASTRSSVSKWRIASTSWRPTINRLEDAIAEYEAALQTFVSAEETQRLTQELAATRTELQNRMAEWEELGQALQT